MVISMVARKKKNTKQGSSSTRVDSHLPWATSKQVEFTRKELKAAIASQTLIMRSEVRKVQAQFPSVDGKLAKIDERFAQIDQRFAQIDERFAKVDERFAQIDERFAQIDERFAQIDERFAQIDQRFAQIDERFAQMDARLAKLEERFDRLEARVDRLEAEIKEVKSISYRILAIVEEQKAENRFVMDKLFELERQRMEIQRENERRFEEMNTNSKAYAERLRAAELKLFGDNRVF